MKLAIFLVVAVLLISCTPTLPENKVCQTDLDCVPAQCCHATYAVNRDQAPDCSNKICTLECAPGSIDCGQGGIACLEGACQVILYAQ